MNGCERGSGSILLNLYRIATLQAYPEFCRQLLYESGNTEYLEATAEWERAYGKVIFPNTFIGVFRELLKCPCTMSHKFSLLHNRWDRGD